MGDRHTKVVGYFAYSGQEVICTNGEACVVTGSLESMKLHLQDSGIERHTIKKTRFGEILKGLNLGSAYAFDGESYGRFYPLAMEERMAVPDLSAFENRPSGSKFIAIKIET